MTEKKKEPRRRPIDIFDRDLNRRGRPKRHIVRKMFLLIILVIIFLAANAYYTLDSMKDGGISVEGYVDEDSKSLFFNYTLSNDGLLPLELDVTLELYDLRNGIDLGNHTVDISLGIRDRESRTIKLSLSNESLNAAKESDGLIVKYTPVVKGTYARYLNIPETTLDSGELKVTV